MKLHFTAKMIQMITWSIANNFKETYSFLITQDICNFCVTFRVANVGGWCLHLYDREFLLKKRKHMTEQYQKFDIYINNVKLNEQIQCMALKELYDHIVNIHQEQLWAAAYTKNFQSQNSVSDNWVTLEFTWPVMGK